MECRANVGQRRQHNVKRQRLDSHESGDKRDEFSSGEALRSQVAPSSNDGGSIAIVRALSNPSISGEAAGAKISPIVTPVGSLPECRRSAGRDKSVVPPAPRIAYLTKMGRLRRKQTAQESGSVLIVVPQRREDRGTITCWERRQVMI
ncbi:MULTISPECIES: hypothetical protein [unclassified Sinorhizobium]|uniref:hypothetical protein n=1 Tax=unclassified Sinorhizobium TaxID=2613772 RepID=UPI0024C3A4C2|nr:MULTISPECIES: hypothetical protein [unclassified Sinorhizobium]MDK1373727.1 hypothetical protein [Sinorhizobium sp. 6-70]MDK1478772.1 hypothetical protein [Sinorhizobium sp. 6-117]